MDCETLGLNTDGTEGLMAKHEFRKVGNDETKDEFLVYDGLGKDFKAD